MEYKAVYLPGVEISPKQTKITNASASRPKTKALFSYTSSPLLTQRDRQRTVIQRLLTRPACRHQPRGTSKHQNLHGGPFRKKERAGGGVPGQPPFAAVYVCCSNLYTRTKDVFEPRRATKNRRFPLASQEKLACVLAGRTKDSQILRGVDFVPRHGVHG